MARTTALVDGPYLTATDEGGEVVVGAAAWYAWLEGATTFAFSGEGGRFTARKERRGATGWYWKAYRRRAGKLYSAYLGKSTDLSFERLTAVALDLSTRGAQGVSSLQPKAATGAPSNLHTTPARATPIQHSQRSQAAQAAVTGSMPRADPLLATKLYVPAPSSTLVPRHRLVAQLREGLENPTRKLTVVSAPVGWGKTTLLSDWCSDLQTSNPNRKWTSGPGPPGARVAWVSLDSSDNDSISFWTYVISALDTLYPGAGDTSLALLRSPEAPAIETVLITLLNKLASRVPPGNDASSRAVLVLDDYHVIDSLNGTQPIHGALTFLLENLPPHLHMVIASRADPPLPLARLRARGALTELRAADLRFTPDEAADFLREILGFDLSAADVAALDERTEGWIAGLQLAALAMKDRTDVRGFISGFTGTNRLIIDYLAEEVLQRQPEEIRSFLLHTSILDSMSASLCDAVIGPDAEGASLPASSSQGMLEQLEHANLFITTLDDERVWYRYHHLFADVLRAHLRRERPDLPTVLYRRAAEWCEGEELVSEALRYALASGNHDYAAQMIETRFEAMLFGRGDFATVRSWFGMLPEGLVTARPVLSLAYATLHLITNGMAPVSSYLDIAEQTLSKYPSLASDVQARIYAMRGLLAVRYGEWQAAADVLKAALETLPAEDSYRGLALYTLGRLYLVGGASPRSRCGLIFAQAVEFNQRNGYVMLTILSLNGVAGYQTLEGRLHDAAVTCQEGLLLAQRQRAGMVATAVNLSIRLSLYYYEWDDLDSALRYALSARQTALALGFTALLATATDVLAQTLHARGDHEGARAALLEGTASGARTASTRVVPGFSATPGTSGPAQRPPLPVGARIRHQGIEPVTITGEQPISGDLQRAEELGLTAGDEPIPQYEMEYLALARRLLNQPEGRASGFRLLERLLESGEANGNTGSIIASLALQAIGLASQGRQSEGLTLLERALTLGEPGGFIRTFIDEGPPMEALLRVAKKQRIAREYVEKLLRHFGIDADQKRQHPVLEDDIEPLTPRELDVLRLIVGGASNREIAEILVVVLGTVKRHTNNLYGKLGVTSRTQAVARAHELHLL